MIDLVQQLLQAKAEVQANPGASVTISLDANDPNAQKLLAFAKKLMIPTVKIRPSGLTTKTGIDYEANALEFLAALRETLGDDLYHELMVDLDGQLGIQRAQEAASQVAEVGNQPEFWANAVQALGAAGVLADSPLRQKAVAVEDALRRGEGLRS